MHYLGHVITAESIKPTTSHTEAIQEFAALKDVKAYLSLVKICPKFFQASRPTTLINAQVWNINVVPSLPEAIKFSPPTCMLTIHASTFQYYFHCWVSGNQCLGKDVQTVYQAGWENSHANALSRQPYLLPPEEGISEGDVQICTFSGSWTGEENIESLLKSAASKIVESDELAENQWKDRPIITYFEEKCLPNDKTEAQRIMSLYSSNDDIQK